MAKEASMSLLFLSFFIFCCSGTLVGFSNVVREDTESPTSDDGPTPTFLVKNKISQPRVRFLVTEHKRSEESAQFSDRVSKYLDAGSQISRGMAALLLYAEEVHTTESVTQKDPKLDDQGKPIDILHIRRTLDETNTSPATIFPTNPTSATPNTPGIITVPSTTSPVIGSPTNPAAVPTTTVPSTSPVPPLSPTNQANPPPSMAVPGTQPVTNPAASYPPPSGTVPVTNPLSSPPATSTNAPGSTTSQGQSWCVAKTGIPATTLQSALDYACGMPSVDCSQIQQGGSCYNPNSLQNHASFAFNSYYQKNPASTSCDFGGAATIVTTNPSTGSCVFPSSSSSAVSSTSGSGTSPFPGSQSPSPDAYAARSVALRPSLGLMVLIITLVTGRLSMKQ